jgi:hypothetical protein
MDGKKCSNLVTFGIFSEAGQSAWNFWIMMDEFNCVCSLPLFGGFELFDEGQV